jgi:predicted tellurium resistance membrane protein TerC
MAWERRRFRDVDHLRATERVWGIWGACVFAALMIVLVWVLVRGYQLRRAIESMGVTM